MTFARSDVLVDGPSESAQQQEFMQGFLPTALSYCKDNAMGTL